MHRLVSSDYLYDEVFTGLSILGKVKVKIYSDPATLIGEPVASGEG